MENAASQAMARKSRPVRCRNCGYAFTPVSGFCPNCLELRPLGRRMGLVPIAVLAGLVALGAAVFAASSTGAIALRPAATQASSSPLASSTGVPPTATQATSPSATATSATTPSSAPSVTTPPSPSATQSVSPSTSATPSSNVAASAAPSSPRPFPLPTAVLGNQTTPTPSGGLPSTATSPGTGTGGRRY